MVSSATTGIGMGYGIADRTGLVDAVSNALSEHSGVMGDLAGGIADAYK